MTNSPRLSVSVVGAGPVGLALAKAFADAGHSVVAIATTDPARVDQVSQVLPGLRIGDVASVVSGVDLVIFAIPGSENESLIRGLVLNEKLKPGQMLFYESAKCLHGRMKTFRGSYYGSIFVHYKPVDKNIWNFDVEKVIANVPPHWNEDILDESGSRWAGQAITTDSRVAEGAPPRFRDTTHGRKSGRAGEEEKRRLRRGKA